MIPDQSADIENASNSPGERFRSARESQGLTVESVAGRLRVPVSIIEAIERDRFEALGAAIYVRGHVAAYARLLGMPTSVVDQICERHRNAPPPLVAMAPSTRFQRFADRLARRAVYIVLTGAIVLPVIWYASQGAPEVSRVSLSPLDPVPTGGDATAGPLDPAVVAAEPVAANGDGHYPVVASLAPFYARTAPVPPAGPEPAVAPNEADELVLSFTGPSWIDVYDHENRRVEQALVPAGSERRYSAGQVARITLGNADAVEIRQGGKAVDLNLYRRANVARFTVSSDGTLAPAGG